MTKPYQKKRGKENTKGGSKASTNGSPKMNGSSESSPILPELERLRSEKSLEKKAGIESLKLKMEDIRLGTCIHDLQKNEEIKDYQCRICGMRFDSVTAILSVWPSPYCKCDECQEKAKPYAEKGTKVHKLIETGETPPPELAGYIRAKDRFLAATGLSVTDQEQSVWDDHYAVAGRADCFGMGNNAKFLIDWKTGKQHFKDLIQLSAYRVLAENRGFHVVGAIPVYLRDDETYEDIFGNPDAIQPILDTSRYFITFLDCLRVFRTHKKYGH